MQRSTDLLTSRSHPCGIPIIVIIGSLVSRVHGLGTASWASCIFLQNLRNIQSVFAQCLQARSVVTRLLRRTAPLRCSRKLSSRIGCSNCYPQSAATFLTSIQFRCACDPRIVQSPLLLPKYLWFCLRQRRLVWLLAWLNRFFVSLKLAQFLLKDLRQLDALLISTDSPRQ